MNKLMIFGDSIFKGVTYSEEKNRYTICDATYADKLSLEGIITENYSKMGATVGKIDQILEKKLGTIDKNTTVIFEFGGNDSDYDWQKISDDPNTEHIPHTINSEFKLMYKKLIAKVKKLGANVIISNLTPIDSEKYMEWIAKGKNYDNIMTFLGDKSMLYRWQEYYNDTVEKIAEDMDCPILDVRNEFLMSHKYKNMICSDGLHPTPYGYEIIDEAIYNYIKNNILASKSAVTA